jgi:choline dehydrogenase-like flavoprotein
MSMTTSTNSYDFVVVGAGTAGSVIASRLTEDPGTRVLLLEAGGATPPPASAAPPVWPTMIGTSVDWGDSTTVQSATGSSVRLVRGRGIGGSPATNGMMFVRGHRASYAAWENVGVKSWGFDDLLHYFKRSETVVGGDPALMVPALSRPNLDFVADALVHQLRIENGRCTGLEYSTSTATSISVAYSGEVMLTAGTIGSAQLLMLSGIDPQAHLRDVGVEGRVGPARRRGKPARPRHGTGGVQIHTADAADPR